jgi:cell division protein FtsW
VNVAASTMTYARSGSRGNTLHIDSVTIAIVLSIVLLGLIMVTSASVSVASKEAGQPFYYLERQLLLTLTGLAGAMLLFCIRTDVLERISVPLLVTALGLLFIVLVPGLGHVVNGSRRWLRVAGINFQVSELARVLVLIYLASYMLFIAGARLRYVIAMTVTATAGFGLLAVTSSYRLRRLTAFLDPWADPFNSGFQLTQSLIAIGRGQWFGVGLGESVQKLFYLPEAHTDFLFAVLAEELGLAGVALTLGLFVALIWRSFYIARLASEAGLKFQAYLASGFGLWVGIQAFINMGVNMGVLPTKGLTLPLMSYGRSSLIVSLVWVGLLLRVYHEAMLERRGSVTVRRRGAEAAEDDE